MSSDRPTMRDVAERAGVSLKTVSRVINAEAGVTPATAERVTAAIAELGFERNDLAASLRSGRSSSTLGLVIEDVANPFYSAVAQAVEAAARDRGFLLITALRPRGRRSRAGARRRAAAPPRRRAADRPRRPRPPLHRRGLLASRLPRPPAARHRGRHRPARRPRRRPQRGRAPDRARTHADRLRRRRRRALHDAPSASPATARRSRPPASSSTRRCSRPAPATSPAPAQPPPASSPSPTSAARPRCSPPTTATRSAPLHALAGAPPVALAGFDDFELADLLGTTVVRADPWKLGEQGAALAFARLDGDERPPLTVTIPTELVTRGSGRAHREATGPPAQPVPPLLQGRRAHRRAARRPRGRGRPTRGLGRLDRHVVGLGDRGPEPARGRHGPQGRDRRRPRGVPRPRARRPLRRRPRPAGQAPRRRRAPARPLPPGPPVRASSTSASATARPSRG